MPRDNHLGWPMKKNLVQIRECGVLLVMQMLCTLLSFSCQYAIHFVQVKYVYRSYIYIYIHILLIFTGFFYVKIPMLNCDSTSSIGAILMNLALKDR